MEDDDIKTDWLPRYHEVSDARGFTFNLVKNLASTASRAHPFIREKILFRSLKILKDEFPLQDQDVEAELIYLNLLQLAKYVKYFCSTATN